MESSCREGCILRLGGGNLLETRLPRQGFAAIGASGGLFGSGGGKTCLENWKNLRSAR